MTCKSVNSQEQLDAALADADVTCIHIESEQGVWLTVSASTKRIEARGSASVEAWGSASVVARGSASVEAWGSASVVAWDSASVVARGSASVEARGSASVEAWGSASVEAWGATRVSAYDRSTVMAGSHVAVHLHSAQAAVMGGVLIDLTQLDLTDPAAWCAHHGVHVEDGRAVLYKAVDADLTAGKFYDKPTVYTVGSEVACDDWRDDDGCGGGLHLSPHHRMAGVYERGPAASRRYLRVTAAVESLRPISADKCKSPNCLVEAEVDARGRELVAD